MFKQDRFCGKMLQFGQKKWGEIGNNNEAITLQKHVRLNVGTLLIEEQHFYEPLNHMPRIISKYETQASSEFRERNFKGNFKLSCKQQNTSTKVLS